MRSHRPKIFTPLLKRPLLVRSLEPFIELALFSEILVACPPDCTEDVSNMIRTELGKSAPVRLIHGGTTRQESVAKCLQAVTSECDMVAVHDGARPLLTSQLLLRVLNKATETDAAIAAVPCKDTIKRCTEDGIVVETLDRSAIWLVQTPQCFRFDLLVSAHEKARHNNFSATDDAALVESVPARVHVVQGSYDNIKITTPEDILVCEEILRQRMHQCGLE
jgi:2-C-methyl-D-erythritol 4-phosphate cytidylyltransferase